VGFHSSKGGKMPGLCGGQVLDGSNNALAAGRRAICGGQAASLECWLSDATTTGYGTGPVPHHRQLNWQADGLWHTIAQDRGDESPGPGDGSITVFYDGKQVAQQNRGHFRATGDTDPSTR